MTSQGALLEALAAGGKQAGDAYLAAQEADKAAQANAIKAALAHSAGLNIPGEAQGQLSAIISQPFQNAATYSDATNKAFADQSAARLSAATEWGDRNAPIQEDIKNRATYDLIRKIQMMFEDGSSGGGSGGGGSGGGGGGGGGGGRSHTAEKASDWVKNLRNDLGIVGSGIATKSKDVEGRLRQLSLEPDPNNPLPRNLREREYLQKTYQAPESELDKAAPVTGFLKDAAAGLEEAIQRKISYEKYIKRLHQEARHLKGDQRKAVVYMTFLARQNLQVNKPASLQNPKANDALKRLASHFF